MNVNARDTDEKKIKKEISEGRRIRLLVREERSIDKGEEGDRPL